eukprot:TRINITY_DN14759_c0_g1_i1.p1 TRINITY_DN14759_c0_g1~~TRINITY_DN14759_c0_g1_i1.p1  ORF type:complete len:500 (-),score=142.56 TRINITY_DN14759_c0_g1_i1:138-1637(-)
MDSTNPLKSVLNHTVGSTEWVAQVQNFCDTNDAADKFVDVLVTAEEKETIFKSLVTRIQETEDDAEMKACACAVRILLRETYGTDVALTEEFLLAIWKLCGISEEDRPRRFGLPATTEISKCLVNVIFKGESQNFQSICVKHNFHRKLAAFLADPPSLPMELAFPVLRVLSLVSKPTGDDFSVHRLLADEGIITVLFSLIRFWLSKEGFPSTPAEKLALHEVLHVLFGITVDMGTLARGEVMSYEKYLPTYETDIPLLLKVLCLPGSLSDKGLYDIKIAVMNCFVNIPIPYYRILVVLGDPDDTLKNLFDIIEYELTTTQDARKSAVSLLMVMRNLLFAAPEVREYAFQRLFPGRNLEEEAAERERTESKVNIDVPDKDRKTVGNLIIKEMTSFNTALQYVANDSLFTLVGEDADLFVQLTGFGNAAGLLAMRGLFGMSQHTQAADTATQVKKKFPELIPEREGETEEDKEDRMVRNFEKLVDAGVFQLVKGDPGEQKK